jgi:hypothetical protein
MFGIRLAVSLLLTVAFLPTLAAAQYSNDAGQYVILSAQYGTERNHVDVTNRLKELAQRDRVFRMGNSTFGVDPDRGEIKALRIYARGADGRERMFEYREGSTVDGSQFRGWDRGEWGQEGWSGRWEGGSNNSGNYNGGNYNGGNYNGGNYNAGDARDAGQYVILSAQYGTKNHHVDVTDRLKELARRDRTFYMNNNTFGVDPDRGRTKVLRIYTRGPDGRQRKFEYREGSTVDGSQFSSWGRGEWANERWSGRW